MKFVLPSRRRRGVYTVTDAQRPMSEDISYRQRRYLISMGIRVVAFLLAVFLFHGVWRFIAAAIALVVPYFAVVFANGGREPNNASAFEPFEPNLPERHNLEAGPLATGDGAAADENNTACTAADGAAGDGRRETDRGGRHRRQTVPHEAAVTQPGVPSGRTIQAGARARPFCPPGKPILAPRPISVG